MIDPASIDRAVARVRDENLTISIAAGPVGPAVFRARIDEMRWVGDRTRGLQISGAVAATYGLAQEGWAMEMLPTVGYAQDLDSVTFTPSIEINAPQNPDLEAMERVMRSALDLDPNLRSRARRRRR